MRGRVTVLALALLAVSCQRDAMPSRERASGPERYGLGRTPSRAELAAVNIDILPDGKGLPPGSGTARAGAAVFAAKCALCHGPNGEGLGAFPKLIGREPRDSFQFGRDVKLVKTIGNYWPYSTTLFDYIRRAMPYQAPGSLSNEDVYNLVAFLLARNEIIAENAVIDAATLPRIQMPARKRFVPDNRKGGKQFE